MASPYDTPAKWFSPEILQEPAGFDMVAFQKRINQAVGTSLTGAPIIRLGWTPSVIHWVAPTDENDKILKDQGEWQPKYAVFSAGLEGVGVIRLAAPRFVLEQRIEPAQYLPNWNHDRFGDPPTDGMYEFLCYIADHGEVDENGDGDCCHYAKRRYRKGEAQSPACYGLFRFPGPDTIELLQYAQREIEKREKHLNPHAPLSEQAIAEAQAWGRTMEERRQARRSNEAAERAKNFYDPIAHRIGCDDPSVLSHGRYHDVTGSLQKSKWKEAEGGLVVPAEL